MAMHDTRRGEDWRTSPLDAPRMPLPDDGPSPEEVRRSMAQELAQQVEQLRDQQHATQQALAWFEVLFATLPVPVLLLDTLGMVVDANRSAIDCLALPPLRERQVLPLRRLLQGSEADRRWVNTLAMAQSTGQAELDEQEVGAVGQAPRRMRLRLQRVDNEEAARRSVAFICTLTDQTEQVKAREAEALQLAAEQREREAQTRANARSQMLSRVSHELRTPLNAIIGFAQLLGRDAGSLPEAQRSYLGHIQTAGRELLALVDEVLDINRAETGQVALDMVAVSLHDEALAALHMHQPDADACGVRLSLTPPTVPLVRADARRVREILGNLISNAIKYGRPGGQVSVSTGHDERLAWIEVRDDGVGLSPAQLDHLFEPFNRLGAERGRVKGHGLGLSICKSYSEAMGGQLLASSAPGAGSCFRLTLPRWDALRG